MIRVLLLLTLLLPTAPTHGAGWETLVKRGEALERQFRTDEALAVFLEADRQRPRDSFILSKIAKQYGESMADTTDRDEKIRRGRQALDYAQRAVAANPRCATAHLSVAVCYGRLAFLSDNRTKISYSREVKRHGDLALQLDPSNDLAWHLLGAWHRGMSDLNPILRGIAQIAYGQLPPASKQEALQCFQKAVALNPRRPGNHLQLGKVYASVGRVPEARAALEKGLALPDVQRDDPENKRKARALLATL